MVPTNGQFIFAFIILIVGIIILARAWFEKDDTVEITDKKLWEWERREKEWK